MRTPEYLVRAQISERNVLRRAKALLPTRSIAAGTVEGLALDVFSFPKRELAAKQLASILLAEKRLPVQGRKAAQRDRIFTCPLNANLFEDAKMHRKVAVKKQPHRPGFANRQAGEGRLRLDAPS